MTPDGIISLSFFKDMDRSIFWILLTSQIHGIPDRSMTAGIVHYLAPILQIWRLASTNTEEEPEISDILAVFETVFELMTTEVVAVVVVLFVCVSHNAKLCSQGCAGPQLMTFQEQCRPTTFLVAKCVINSCRF